MAHRRPSTVAPEASRAGRADRIGLDDLFDALRARWRRRAVRYLAERSPVAATADEFVADLFALSATPDDRSSVRTAFHHTHLPKLDALDVVDYDCEAGTVAPGPNLDEAAACLDAVEGARA